VAQVFEAILHVKGQGIIHFGADPLSIQKLLKSVPPACSRMTN
jgi:hypothetical protein